MYPIADNTETNTLSRQSYIDPTKAHDFRNLAQLGDFPLS